ncbi:MAG TPA: IS30 family transposase [Streptosporangiaceae bacterium]|nr:IS30 family transposase [Streptosporangiaceae bacterium]
MEVAAMKNGRPAAPRAVQVQFWEGVRSGLGVQEAGLAAGVGPVKAFAWFRQAGGVKSNGPRRAGGRYLSVAEREEIAVGLAAGDSLREIAGRLGRAPSTVSREVRRNSRGRGQYRALAAQGHAQHRAARPKTAKLAGNAELRGLVAGRLERKWSPEQVSMWLRREFPDRPEMQVSHETIYQSLYVQGRGALRRELAACLRTGRALRKPRRKDGERRGKIPGMVMISERPAEAEDRAVPGHWEGDLIAGAGSRSAIGTLVERSTRFVLLLHLPSGHGADAVAAQMTEVMATLPAALRRSLTWDQGREMSSHAQIAAATDLDVYFCDPHSPWQRGSNENTNGLLRQYFPKGTDLSVHTREDLDAVAAELNARPRKTLGWKTPAEALDEILAAAA